MILFKISVNADMSYDTMNFSKQPHRFVMPYRLYLPTPHPKLQSWDEVTHHDTGGGCKEICKGL